MILVRAQLAAFAKSLKLNWPVPQVVNGESQALLALEEGLVKDFSQMATLLKSVPAWHMALGGHPDARNPGVHSVVSGLALARKLRNSTVHSLKAETPHASSDFEAAMMPLMDAASYWGDYPWLINLRLEHGRWVGDRLVGQTERVWDEKLPDAFSARAPQSDHVVQLWWRPEAGAPAPAESPLRPALVDAWPWLRRVRGSQGPDIAALWYPLSPPYRGSQRWRAETFGGESQEVEVQLDEF